MSARRPDRTGSVEVQLDDDDAVVGAAGAPDRVAGTPTEVGGRPGPRTGPRTGPRRGRRRRLGAALVAVVAIGGATLVADRADARRDERRLAALAALPFVLDGLDAGLAEVWRVAADRLVGEVGGVMVLAVEDGLVGVDGATGQRLWERTTGSESCEPFTPTPFGDPFGTGPAPAADRLLCSSTQRVGTPNESTTAVLVDPLTGRDGPSILMGGREIVRIVRDGEVVLVNDRGRGIVEAVRWDPVTGGARWRTRSEPGALPDGQLAALWWDRTTFGITDREQTYAISLDTGAAVPAGPGDVLRFWAEVDLPDGGRAVWGSRGVELPVPPPSGQVLERDGRVRFDLPGPPLGPRVDDGSVPEVLLVGRPPREVVGLDAATGEERWAATMRTLSGSPMVRVDGVLVLRADRSSVALDVASGEVLWEVVHRGDDFFEAAALTDGRVVLLWHEDDGVASLVAHDLHDGRALWRAALPDEARWVEPTASGRIAVTGAGWVSVLG